MEGEQQLHNRAYTIKLGADIVSEHYGKHFKRCIGTERVATALRADYMDNLRIVQNEIGFDYIRGHGLFHDELGVYRERIRMDAKQTRTLKEPLYNWIFVKKCIDHYRSVGIKPFFELGFMPEQMASGGDSVFWWKGNVSSPDDYAKWGRLVGAFARFLIEHYGEEAVSWPFEVWNEPNSAFWAPADGALESGYYRLYETAARALKEVDERLHVGGPATNPGGLDWIPRFIDFCVSARVPLDFVSHHVYSGHNKQYSGEFIHMEIMDPVKALNQFKRAAEQVKASPLPELPVHITEWNTSYSCIDPVHDTAMNAAYIAWLLVHADETVDSYAYWVFSDVFEEADIPRALFHGGFGLLTHNGLRKPVFHAFRFANALYETLLYRDDHVCVTRNEADGSLAVLLYTPDVHMTSEEPTKLSLELPFAAGMAVMEVQTVDSQAGNAYEAWKMQTIAAEVDGNLRLQFMLAPNSIKLARIDAVNDYSGGYEGLREKEVL
ncbi:MAG: Xylan 1,4-beta-xylosidase [Paenibacillus sp.]|nr:Xylan 1,4-beta-xylosidase [Paenibacillus sp.]